MCENLLKSGSRIRPPDTWVAAVWGLGLSRLLRPDVERLNQELLEEDHLLPQIIQR